MNTKKTIFAMGLLGIAILAFYGIFLIQEPETFEEDAEIQSFDSETEMMDYIQSSDDREQVTSRDDVAYEDGMDSERTVEGIEDGVVQDGEETFRQVSGIQEPSFAKLADELYYSPTAYRSELNTTVLETPELNLRQNITESGELLKINDTLVVLDDQSVTGLEIDDYNEVWQRDLGEYADDGTESRLVTARGFDDSVLLLLRTDIDYDSPCPYRPMEDVSVPCRSIVYPGYDMNADRTYTAIELDLEGEVMNKNSFIGDFSTEFYVTENSLYVSYGEQERSSEIVMDFLLEYASISSDLEERINEIESYDLSERSVMIEVERAMSELVSEDALEDIEDQIEDYTEERKRDVEESKIVRFDNDLDEDYVVTVPGNIRDRMDLHERDGKLYGLNSISSHSALANFDSFYDFFVVEDGEVTDYSEEFLETRWTNTKYHQDKLYVGDREELRVYNYHEEELVNEFDIGSAEIYPLSEGSLVVGSTEDWNTTFVYLDENYEIIDEKISERGRHFRTSNVQVDDKRNKAVIAGRSDTYVLSFSDNELDYQKINATGMKSFITQEFVYIVDSDKVYTFDDELDRYSSFEVPLIEPEEFRERHVVESQDVEAISERNIESDVLEA